MPPAATTSVPNFDVAGIGDLMTRFCEEMIACQSANTTEFNEHDRSRAIAYLDYLMAYTAVVTTPVNPLDLPKTHPEQYPFKTFPDDERINGIENPIVRSVCRRWKAGWIEITESSSNDRASGLYQYDLDRLSALVENMRAVITFGENLIDMPENPYDVVPT